uniref:WAS/WASL interacting protein family, member 2b n=1 Tax=Nothobranchius rachovii TaxID=451742 RepID=A0A1A8RNM4_9TELE
MPIPPPPPPPGGPPPPPTLCQANTNPPKLSGDEAKGRDALLSDICKGTRLKKVAVVNDRSAPLLDSKTQTPKSQTPPTEHPYIRLYQYLQHQNQPKQQGAPSEEMKRTAGDQSSSLSLQKSKGGGAAAGANCSAAGIPSGSVPPMGSLFTGSIHKLRSVGDTSSGRSPSTRGAAPRPPSQRPDNPESPSPQISPMCSQRPSLPNLSSSPAQSAPSSAASSPSAGMKHSSSAPPPPPPLCRRGNAPSPPSTTYNRDKPLPPTPNNTPPLPSKPPPSPSNGRRPPTSGGNSTFSTTSSLALPRPPYRINGPTGGAETAPELPQRHNSLSNKRPAPSPGGHTPTRGPAPPLPPASPTPSQQGANRPMPPVRDPPCRGAAPPVPAQSSSSSSSSLRAGGREAPPPPPYRTHGSPSLPSELPGRGKPPPPPSRTPAALPPPPPPLRNGHSTSSSIPRSFVDDFESKYSFHPLDDFPPPDEYRHFTKIYPSKANRVMRGAPPLPPVGR